MGGTTAASQILAMRRSPELEIDWQRCNVIGNLILGSAMFRKGMNSETSVEGGIEDRQGFCARAV